MCTGMRVDDRNNEIVPHSATDTDPDIVVSAIIRCTCSPTQADNTQIEPLSTRECQCQIQMEHQVKQGQYLLFAIALYHNKGIPTFYTVKADETYIL